MTASVAAKLGAHVDLVEFEWFETHPSEQGLHFEGRARVSASQPGDLHAEHYDVHGAGRSVADGDDTRFEVQELQVTRMPDVPPEPRP